MYSDTANPEITTDSTRSGYSNKSEDIAWADRVDPAVKVVGPTLGDVTLARMNTGSRGGDGHEGGGQGHGAPSATWAFGGGHQGSQSLFRYSQPRTIDTERFQGRVVQLDDAFVTAEMFDSAGAEIDVVAEFPRSILDVEDLAVGDVFYVTTTTVFDEWGHPRKQTALRVRLLGRWSDEDVTLLQKRARARYQDIEQLIG